MKFNIEQFIHKSNQQQPRIKAYPLAFSFLSINLGMKFIKEAKDIVADRKENFSDAEELDSKLSEMNQLKLTDDKSLLIMCLGNLFEGKFMIIYDGCMSILICILKIVS